MHATNTVDDLRDAQINDQARQRQRVQALKLILLAQQIKHCLQRDHCRLVQVSIDEDPSRGGVGPPGVAEVAEAIEAEPGLIVGGVMSVAPLGMLPIAAFEVLRDCSDVVRTVNPGASIISAGMSGDMEDAIACGATHLRIGTALLGNRRPPVR